MLKNNTIAAFLIIIIIIIIITTTILFPLFHHAAAIHVLNHENSVEKNALKINCNTFHSNITVIPRTTKINDIELSYEEIFSITKKLIAKNFLMDLTTFIVTIAKYSFA
ncbi:MAG TPA: hypothetical protein PLZ38_07415 [Spirochaetota bacterium]|nr:hypothetical protein [Spirochaetota bacterium]